MIELTIGCAALGALFYNSYYQIRILNWLRAKRPTGGIYLFLLDLMSCGKCYTFWLTLIFTLSFGFFKSSLFASAISAILAEMIIKKMTKL